MILAIDVGNSVITIGAADGGEIRSIVHLHTDLNDTPEEYAVRMKQMMDYVGMNCTTFEGAIISSVVPPVTESLREAVRDLTGLESMVVGPGIRTGMNVRIDDPGTLAAGMAVDSVAAIACYGAPVMVLNMGTATVLSVIDEKGSYRGGAIMPGVKLGLQALSERTSLLPDISFTAPKKAIGTNTVDAMRSGAVLGTASMVEGLIDRMEQELGTACTVVATGAPAEAVLPHCRRKILYDEHLTLKGLWLIYEKNKVKKK